MPHSAAGDILTIRQLAEYLMVSEKTVYRMLDRNELPAVRVGAQWRFRRQDIDSWITDQVRRIEVEGHRDLAETLQPAELEIAPLLSPGNVWLGIRPRGRDDLLATMVAEAELDPGTDRDLLLRSILDREALCSTAMVPNAAFPHPVDPRPFRFSRKRVLLAALGEPLDYRDPHGHRPRVIVLILARSMQGHLLALSRALKLFGDPALVDTLASAATPAAAVASIASAERQLAPAMEPAG